MEFKILGNSGIEVSAVGLGCNNFGRRIGEKDSREIVQEALDVGVTFFDTAESYGGGESEKYLGKALGGRRRDIVIATKFGWGGRHNRRNVEEAINNSLRRLGTDYVDLYQIHKPDEITPISETLAALDSIVRAGKVRAIGCSNFNASQLSEAVNVSKAHNIEVFCSAQNEYSLLRRDAEQELVPVCRKSSVGILPYYPLCGGLLTGKYQRGIAVGKECRLGDGGIGSSGWLTDANFDIVEKLSTFAEARGQKLLDLAMSWLAMKPEIASVIAGARRLGQVTANVKSAEWNLSEDEVQGLESVFNNAV